MNNAHLAEEQALDRAFDRMSALRATLNTHRGEIPREVFAYLWYDVLTARLAISTAREILTERTLCQCGHARKTHWTASPPYPMMGCRDCDDCMVYEAKER